jgi:hypothetical protein
MSTNADISAWKLIAWLHMHSGVLPNVEQSYAATAADEEVPPPNGSPSMSDSPVNGLVKR